MNLDLFNDLFNNETNTIETDTLSIKEHAISTQDDVIQIDNISITDKFSHAASFSGALGLGID
ncbi:hypothetical protein LGW04_02935, partial [Streptococcus mutans]|nr:hypothetical protein [Streptococcus mutans]